MTTQPDIEWWYALPTGKQKELSVLDAKDAYKRRFGCEPTQTPRELMIGTVTALAYPVPQTPYTQPAIQTIHIDPPAPALLFDVEGL